jgi:hypothetical protein
LDRAFYFLGSSRLTIPWLMLQPCDEKYKELLIRETIFKMG